VKAHDACRYSPKGRQLLVERGSVYCVSAGDDGLHRLTVHPSGGPEAVVVSAPFDVRSKVQGYGGGAFCVHDGVVYFVNHADQRVYRCSPGGLPTPVTAEGPYAHADLSFDAKRHRLICIREVGKDHGHVETQIVSISLDEEGAVRVLVHGRDFYAAPRMSLCGEHLAWIAWDFPDMPWNRSSLLRGRVDEDGLVSFIEPVVDRDAVSVIEPLWAANGDLLYLSDESGYWSLHAHSEAGIRVLPTMAGAEFGWPPYVVGLCSYCEVTDETLGTRCIFALAWVDGEQVLLKIDANRSLVETIALPFSRASHLCSFGQALCFLGETPQHSPSPVRYDTASGRFRHLARPQFDMAGQAVARVTRVPFPTRDGSTAHAILYTGERWPAADAPRPLIVNVHGGPTGAAIVEFDPKIAFWLNHGFSWLDVNHRGSTGYGRAYREALNGKWGELDVEDCVDAVKHLCAQGLADPKRIVIRGASAGGFTALRALATADCFAAATCLSGVTELERLCRTTHKFESQYLHHLVGDPQRDLDVYRARSPLHHPRAIRSPVLFMHGAQDRVVPPDQTRDMAARLEAAGHIAPYIEFAGEGHGFVSPENRAAALSAEWLFYARVLGTPWHRESLEHPALDQLANYFDHKWPAGPAITKGEQNAARQ
jgi:dipeptidyl aminopeptidase/acylaminoacyl peptidase